jgi:shikimate dehydrogenase
MRAAVLGSPIAHSLSPVIHRAGYKALGLDHDYQAIDVTAEAFRGFVASMNTCWMGLSLTMPLKEVAFGVADDITPEALLARSINTLICRDGLHAENTDIHGIVAAVREVSATAFSRAVVVGSGATARSALIASAALGVETATIVARNAHTRADCESLARTLGMSVSPDADETVLVTSDTLVVSTVPAAAGAAVSSRMPHPDGVLLDVIYHPWPSPLVHHWQQRSLPVVPGHLMLLHQAVRQFEMMTGEVAPVSAMRQALEAELANRA